MSLNINLRMTVELSKDDIEKLIKAHIEQQLPQHTVSSVDYVVSNYGDERWGGVDYRVSKVNVQVKPKVH